MYDFEEVQFDEHVKTYQRYQLIALLESNKNEKIRALKEHRKNRAKKVAVPLPPSEMIIIPDNGEEARNSMKVKFGGIKAGVAVPEAVVIEDTSAEDKKSMQGKFAGIKATVDVPAAVVIEDTSAEDKKSIQERFAGIKTTINIPEAESFNVLSLKQKDTKREEMEQLAASIRVPDKIVFDLSIAPTRVPSMELSNIKMVDCSDILEMLSTERQSR